MTQALPLPGKKKRFDKVGCKYRQTEDYVEGLRDLKHEIHIKYSIEKLKQQMKCP